MKEQDPWQPQIDKVRRGLDALRQLEIIRLINPEDNRNRSDIKIIDPDLPDKLQEAVGDRDFRLNWSAFVNLCMGTPMLQIEEMDDNEHIVVVDAGALTEPDPRAGLLRSFYTLLYPYQVAAACLEAADIPVHHLGRVSRDGYWQVVVREFFSGTLRQNFVDQGGEYEMRHIAWVTMGFCRNVLGTKSVDMDIHYAVSDLIGEFTRTVQQANSLISEGRKRHGDGLIPAGEFDFLSVEEALKEPEKVVDLRERATFVGEAVRQLIFGVLYPSGVGRGPDKGTVGYDLTVDPRPHFTVMNQVRDANSDWFDPD